MTRQWKPGDVALVRVGPDYSPEVAVRGSGTFGNKWYVGGPRWGSRHGFSDAQIEGVVRPLVVLDPESEDDAKRLLLALADEIDGLDGYSIGEARAALRSLVAPPKPEEPRAVGAVVEDADGECWTRVDAGWAPWHLGRDAKNYADIAAVKVLSKGVQQ